jgi:hypothetical protein
MSMMLPPGTAPPNLPVAPGGGEAPLPPLDAMNQGPVPAEGGMAGLMAALGGGGAAPGGAPVPPELGGEGPPGLGGEGPVPEDMDPIEHLQEAMKHLMMAIAKEEDEERGLGITKGMGALQGILAGEQKKNAQLSQLGG